MDQVAIKIVLLLGTDGACSKFGMGAFTDLWVGSMKG